MVTNIGFTSAAPRVIANLVPTREPTIMHKAIGIPYVNIIFLLKANKIKDAKLLVKLSIFALAEAETKSNPYMVMKAKIKKEPVPGPKNPS